MLNTQISSIETFGTSSANFDTAELDLNANEAKWSSIFNRFQEISSLEDNWDGFDAPRPEYELILATHQWLIKFMRENKNNPPSRILATLDGTIAFDWEASNIRNQIEFISPNEAEFSSIGDDIRPQLSTIKIGNYNQVHGLTR